MANLMAKQTESNLTEAEAIVRAREGDAAGFEHLYRAHCRRVYGMCLRMIKNSADAEDLTQQAFLQLFGKIGTFRGESGFSTWLHRVTPEHCVESSAPKKADRTSSRRLGAPQLKMARVHVNSVVATVRC